MTVFALLFLACPKKVETENTCPPANAALPDAQMVFDAHQRATQQGPVLEWTTLHQHGMVRIPEANIEGELDIWVDKNGGYLSNLEMSGMGVTEQGWNKDVGWTSDPNTGVRLLEGEELQNIAFTFEEVTSTDLGSLYPTAKVIERRVVDEHDVYVVRVQVKGLRSPTELYFDACNGLQVGSQMMINIPMGRMKVHNIFKNYKLKDGMLMPHTVEQRVMGMLQVIDIDFVDWDPESFPEIQPPAELMPKKRDMKPKLEINKSEESSEEKTNSESVE